MGEQIIKWTNIYWIPGVWQELCWEIFHSMKISLLVPGSTLVLGIVLGPGIPCRGGRSCRCVKTSWQPPLVHLFIQLSKAEFLGIQFPRASSWGLTISSLDSVLREDLAWAGSSHERLPQASCFLISIWVLFFPALYLFPMSGTIAFQ